MTDDLPPVPDLRAPDADGEVALAEALARLEAAFGRLSERLAGRLTALQQAAKTADNLAIERDQLKAALEASRQRERDLQHAAEEASLALDQAIAEVRAVLGEA